MKRAIITLDLTYDDINYKTPYKWNFSKLFDLDGNESIEILDIQDNLPIKEINHVS